MQKSHKSVAIGLIGFLALGGSVGAQNIDKVKKMTAEQAAILVQRPGPLSLGSLASISEETAKALSQLTGPLSLGGLTSLSPDAAKALTEVKGDLSIAGLTTLSAETAAALAQHFLKIQLRRWRGTPACSLSMACPRFLTKLP